MILASDCRRRGSLFISIDALFECVWKCSAGTSGKSSNHGEELFISQEKVDAFPANYSKRPSSKATVCEQKEFFSYFVCCCFTLTFCYPSVLIPLLNHCNERPKVTVCSLLVIIMLVLNYLNSLKG